MTKVLLSYLCLVRGYSIDTNGGAEKNKQAVDDLWRGQNLVQVNILFRSEILQKTLL